jgi:carbamoyl-phosphate synthase small subunit
VLEDGTTFQGQSFGAPVDSDGEVVFSTGMAGYPESMTDPSFRGQILVFTYPLIGNYGVPKRAVSAWGFSELLESEQIHVRGVVVSQICDHPSHQSSSSSLSAWMTEENIPGITEIDTRALTKKLREQGVMLGRIVQGDRAPSSSASIEDPNLRNLVAEVSCKEVHTYDPLEEHRTENPFTIVAYDCGMKRNILRSFLKRGIRVVRVPWNFDLDSYTGPLDGVFVSNGPGDPKQCVPTIKALKRSLEKGIPTFGICLGNQLLSLAIGGDTYKLKYGHRGANQPCTEEGTPGPHCIITSQNHGFAVKDELPAGWKVWWRNANDGTVEGIRHESKPFFSVQFHPEATPGPEDAGYLFDEFVAVMKQS